MSEIDYARVARDSQQRAMQAMADALKLASEKGSDAAVEYLCDYMNGVDYVDDELIGYYETWRAKFNPRDDDSVGGG